MVDIAGVPLGWNSVTFNVERLTFAMVHSIDANDCKASPLGVGTTQSNKSWTVLAVFASVSEKKQAAGIADEVQVRWYPVDLDAFLLHAPRLVRRLDLLARCEGRGSESVVPPVEHPYGSERDPAAGGTNIGFDVEVHTTGIDVIEEPTSIGLLF